MIALCHLNHAQNSHNCRAEKDGQCDGDCAERDPAFFNLIGSANFHGSYPVFVWPVCVWWAQFKSLNEWSHIVTERWLN